MVGYTAIHCWIKRMYGYPKKCEFCGTTKKRRYDWANKSGKYKRDLKDWLRLCVPCHKKYDLKRLKKHGKLQIFKGGKGTRMSLTSI